MAAWPTLWGSGHTAMFPTFQNTSVTSGPLNSVSLYFAYVMTPPSTTTAKMQLPFG